MKEQYFFYVCLNVKNKLTLFQILQCDFVSTTNGSDVQNFASVTR